MSRPTADGRCSCGCGALAPIAPRNDARYGWVKGEPKRYITGHNGRRPGSSYVVDGASGCWLWQRARNRKGYGVARVGSRFMAAHRFTYERACGPIPAGLQLDHLYRNTSCVNPDHLEPVTPAENTRRGRSVTIPREHVREIRALRGVVTQTELARRFGISQSQVSNIQRCAQRADA